MSAKTPRAFRRARQSHARTLYTRAYAPEPISLMILRELKEMTEMSSSRLRSLEAAINTKFQKKNAATDGSFLGRTANGQANDGLLLHGGKAARLLHGCTVTRVRGQVCRHLSIRVKYSRMTGYEDGR